MEIFFFNNTFSPDMCSYVLITYCCNQNKCIPVTSSVSKINCCKCKMVQNDVLGRAAPIPDFTDTSSTKYCY